MTNKKYDYDTEKVSPSILKQKVICNEVVDKRYNKILKLSEKFDSDNLIYC